MNSSAIVKKKKNFVLDWTLQCAQFSTLWSKICRISTPGNLRWLLLRIKRVAIINCKIGQWGWCYCCLLIGSSFSIAALLLIDEGLALTLCLQLFCKINLWHLVWNIFVKHTLLIPSSCHPFYDSGPDNLVSFRQGLAHYLFTNKQLQLNLDFNEIL